MIINPHHDGGKATRSRRRRARRCKVLQLSRSSGAAQVRGAFRLQALMTHPDRGGRRLEERVEHGGGRSTGGLSVLEVFFNVFLDVGVRRMMENDSLIGDC